MILADVFHKSQIARDMEFVTNESDKPVIVQFAASNAFDAAAAAELVAPHVAGVDLNCGCPQKWAIKEGIGASLMEKPELVQDMVTQIRSRTAQASDFSTSVKIRIHDDLKQTVEFVRRAEKCGASFITVHGRTKKQKSHEPVNLEAIKLCKESVSVPVVANGDIFSLKDADDFVAYTKVDGVMAARGLLENPALFSGYSHTPLDCVERFVKLSMAYGSNHFIFHHHLMFMLDYAMPKAEKRMFNCLTSISGILDHLEDTYGLVFDQSEIASRRGILSSPTALLR